MALVSKIQIVTIFALILLAISIATFSLWVMSVFYFEISNSVGTILTVVACDIIGIASVLLIRGNKEVEEETILWENENVNVTTNLPNYISFPFHLDNPSTITGKVSGTSGPYTFFITEYFGTPYEMSERLARIQTGLIIRPKIHFKGKGPNGSIIGPLSLPSGNYALRFNKTGVMTASFSLQKSVHKKPYEKLYSFGLTLLEVGIPILITGVISLGFETFV